MRPTVLNEMNTANFELMLGELLELNVKYLERLLSDLRDKGCIAPWYGDYHKMLIHRIEHAILERTILK